MVDAIFFVICYLAMGFVIGFIGWLWMMLSDCGTNEACNFLLATSVLWPVLIIVMMIRFITSIPKAIKEYVIFLMQLLIK